MAIYPSINILGHSLDIPSAILTDTTQWVSLSHDFDAYRIHYGVDQKSGFEELYRVGEHILLRTIDSEELSPLEADATCLGGHLTFAFKLTGQNTLSHASGKEVSIGPGSLLVGYSQQQKTLRDKVQPYERYAMVTLAIKPHALTEPPLSLASDSLPESINLLIDGKVSEELFVQHYQFDGAIQQCLIALISCPFIGSMRTAYMQSKSHELLCLALDLIRKLETHDKHKTLDPRVYKKLNQVNEILSSSFNNCPSLHELAKTVGMSEASLRNGFKRLFGVTIGERLQQLRMKHAQFLLRHHKGNISQIAHSLGYDHTSNFITAFKRQFGFTPKLYQKQSYSKISK
ncbi:Regulatory protein PchR [Pseudovibrio axinellae]|uniref:Regulatory protein PchR n=1 Tax=Pseudovibrio axinellae TaxID=989403 RepID=A0A165XLL4_9HYPH|nr:AraC family transcriptional regulator [Pseudovibrio axinellae]KZL17821.1 Regulatory protein PchR [Pseudovibrio axinellae]SEP71024.1 AraC-type DNA-binding protein [Pseudovibrio axinellae]